MTGESAETSGDPRLQGVKVLIVEDEAVVAFDLEFSLRDFGCIVLPAVAAVAEALALLDTERPDIALLDVRLRDGPSIPVAERLRAMDVPYVVVTGYDEEQIDGLLLREAPRLAKPYQLVDLQEVLRRTLHGGPGRA